MWSYKIFVFCLNRYVLLFNSKFEKNNHLWSTNSHHIEICSLVLPSLALTVLSVSPTAPFSSTFSLIWNLCCHFILQALLALQPKKCNNVTHPQIYLSPQCVQIWIKIMWICIFLWFFQSLKTQVFDFWILQKHVMLHFIHTRNHWFFTYSDSYFHISCFSFIQGVLVPVYW